MRPQRQTTNKSGTPEVIHTKSDRLNDVKALPTDRVLMTCGHWSTDDASTEWILGGPDVDGGSAHWVEGRHG